MPTPSRYRQSAEDCETLAGNVRDSTEQDILKNIATQFRRLANHKEKRKGARPQNGAPASSEPQSS
jgi:hypothetical protein